MLDQVGELESEDELALLHTSKERTKLTLEVRHERLGARVERVDDHLAISRTGDLDSGMLANGCTNERRSERSCKLTVGPRDPVRGVHRPMKASPGYPSSLGGR